MSTLVYNSKLFLFSHEEDTTRFSNGMRVNLISPIPNPRHSMLTIKVESMEMYLSYEEGPNAGFDIDIIPFKLRICVSCPTTSQAPNNYNNVLCQYSFWDSVKARASPSKLSSSIYNGTDDSSAGVEILDPIFQYFSIYFIDEQGRPFNPPSFYYITLKLEVHRNYAAEQVELLGKLLRGQATLLKAYNLKTPTDGSTSISTEEQGPDILYAPNDSLNQGATLT